MTNIRIGYEHPDTLITYPDAWFLSGCVVPIQIRRSYPEQRFLSRTKAGGLTPPIDGLPTPPRASSAPPQHTQPIRIRAAQARSAAYEHTAHRFLVLQGRTPSDAHPACHACLAKPHLTPAGDANKTHTRRAYKTRPDQPDRWVRARNEIGSGVRTLAVVRAVLTTIATLTTPLRHVILLGFVV